MSGCSAAIAVGRTGRVLQTPIPKCFDHAKLTLRRYHAPVRGGLVIRRLAAAAALLAAFLNRRASVCTK